MKMMYNGIPIRSLNIKHYEIDTNSCDMIASDLQAGKTAVARGKKITGTGKSFEFATYGSFPTNQSVYVPSNVNIVHISSTEYPVKMSITLYDMKNQDFATPLEIGSVFANGVYYPISVSINNHFLSVNCEQTITLQIFYGKDNYV